MECSITQMSNNRARVYPAESEGFEPPIRRNAYTAFRVRLFRPLRQLSLAFDNKLASGKRVQNYCFFLIYANIFAKFMRFLVNLHPLRHLDTEQTHCAPQYFCYIGGKQQTEFFLLFVRFVEDAQVVVERIEVARQRICIIADNRR